MALRAVCTPQTPQNNHCQAQGENAGPKQNDGRIECTDFCGNKGGAMPARVCGIINVGHDTGACSARG
jgi:hypothetical protein